MRLDPKHTGLLILDVQEKLFTKVERKEEVLSVLLRLIKLFQTLDLPIFIAEQFPEKLGETIFPVKAQLGVCYSPLKKTSFSCFDDSNAFERLTKSGVNQWIIAGIEAHICVLQTAKSVCEKGYEAVILNDAISSRSIYDYSTAIAEMRDFGCRITSFETVLFELIKDAKHPDFKALSKLAHECV